MCDEVVVGDATVLSRFLMVGLEEHVRLIAVAEVRSVERSVEVAVVLVLEVAAGIAVVQVEAQARLLAGVYGKAGVDEVFAVGLVAAAAVAEIGDGRQRVGKVPLVRLAQHLVVGVGEEGLCRGPAVGENARQACGIVRAHRVILSVHACAHRRLRVEVG